MENKNSLKDRIESEGFGDFTPDKDVSKPIYEEKKIKKEDKKDIQKSEENEMDYKKWL